MIEKYYYIRDSKNQPSTTVCLLKAANDIGRGVAICSNKDQPCKKTGRKIAKTRAVCALACKHHSSIIRRPGDFFHDALQFGSYKSYFNSVLTEYERKLLSPKKESITYTFGRFHIPDYMMDGINRYIHEGIKPGSFLTAIICNDLTEAVAQADANNLSDIPAFVSYFYNETPSPCWGSADKMNNWLLNQRKSFLSKE